MIINGNIVQKALTSSLLFATHFNLWQITRSISGVAIYNTYHQGFEFSDTLTHS